MKVHNAEVVIGNLYSPSKMVAK